MSDSLMVFNIQKFSLHDGPGIRTVVFLSGCPLRCRWCSNPESQRMGYVFEGEGIQSAQVMKTCKIMSEVRKDKPFYETSGGGLTLSGGEVLTQIDGAEALLSAARAEGIHTCAETSGYASAQDFERLLARLDLVLPDLKHYDSARHLQGTGVELEPILGNLSRLAQSGVMYRVRIPIIPRFNDALPDAERFAALFLQLGLKAVELLPFHQFGERKYELMGLHYAYKDVEALREDQLLGYAQVLRASGLDVVLS